MPLPHLRRLVPAALLLAGLSAGGPALAQRPAAGPPRPETGGTADPGLAAFEARLPADLAGMKRILPPGLTPQPGRISAFYEGPYGRATVHVLEAPPSGQPERQVDGTLHAALAQDMLDGAQALGPGTWTAPPVGERMQVRNGPAMTCGVLERHQGQEGSAAGQLRQMNRLCFAVLDGRLVGIFLSTRYQAEQQAELERQQRNFIGTMALRLKPPG